MESTKDLKIPTNLIDQIIGQDEAVRIAKMAALQRRNLLLVGPPGCGKSLIAQAMASLLPKPNYEISVLDNPLNPERPILEVRSRTEVEMEKKLSGIKLSIYDVPIPVAEKLGLRCKRCGSRSSADVKICPNCGNEKYRKSRSPFDDIIFGEEKIEDRVYYNIEKEGRIVKVLYERVGNAVYYYDEKSLEVREKNFRRKVIVPLDRNTFVQATGASETELLGDVRHDPYGGHPEIGVKPYKRVLPGAIHEAHEGILFIDEVANLGNLQRHLLTAMQEKKFPIIGRNPTSSGASVRVDDVPCDFIFVGAVNFSDINLILPTLRSRILGNGYEVLLNTYMEDTPENRKKIVRFIAQEINKDKRIPHADKYAIREIIEEARRKAKIYDGKEGLTLRLRGLSGIIKLAGDLAVIEGSEFIESKHVREAIERAKSAEQQAEKRYGTYYKYAESEYFGKKQQDYII